MSKSVRLWLGINGAFLTRRWEEPENWMRLTRECGYRVHSFCADVLDPFFSGDREYQMETAHATRGAAHQYGVFINDIYTGVATHRFHGLSHSDPRVRQRMKEWIIECADIANAMGVDAIGGHWDAFSVEVLSDPVRHEEALRRQYTIFRELSELLAQKGIRALYQEQMYIPSESPWTLAEAERFLVEVNRERKGIPVYLTLDVGHCAGMHYGLSGSDLDYVEWIRRFGTAAEVIHLQQTTPDASAHWPFTPEYNAKGHIEVPRVLDSLAESLRNRDEQPWAPWLPLPENIYLICEIIPGSTRREEVVLDELKHTADYLRQWIPEEGLVVTA